VTNRVVFRHYFVIGYLLLLDSLLDLARLLFLFLLLLLAPLQELVSRLVSRNQIEM